MAAKTLRWSGAVVLFVVAALLVTVSLVARYARAELLDTNTYVATVEPLASDPDVQTAVTNRVTTELVDAIDVPQLAQQLAQQSNLTRAPLIAGVISGPISDWLESFIHKHVGDFVASQRFADLWVSINRAAHTQVQAVLTGEGKAIKTKGDSIVLDLGPIIAQVKSDLVASGFAIASKVPNVSVQFTLAQSTELPKIQRAVRLLDHAANWLPWLALLIFGLAVWLAPGHRRGALVGCLVAAVLLVVMLIGLSAAREAYVHQVQTKNLNVPAATTIYDTILRFLVTAVWTWLILTVIIAIWLFLAGPGKIGTGLRRLVGKGEEITGRAIARAGWRPVGLSGYIHRYQRWFFAGLGVLAAVILLLNPTVATAVWLSVIAIVLLLAAGILARIPTDPPAEDVTVATPT